MFEREIKFIYDFNLNKINRLGPYFTFEQLLSSDIHPAILQYISAEIDYLVFEDRQKLLKNSVFDYSGEKISYHFNQISEEVKKTKRFALEYISKLVMHASSFTVNYLIHPKWTLTKFVFDDDNHKSTNEIKQILNYVYYYKYISKILVTYINAKKILSMNAQEFEELLNKAERLGVESNLHEILRTSLMSMAEFFNIGELKKTRIPLVAVELFLEEKELTRHLIKVTEVFGSDENAKFNINEYAKVLGSVMHEIREPEPEPVAEEEFEQEEIKDINPPEKIGFRETIEEEEPEQPETFREIEKEVIDIEGVSSKKAEPEQEKEQEQEHEQEQEFEDIIPEREDVKVQDQEPATSGKHEEEEVTIAGKELIITQPTKIKIRFDDEIHIEPIIEDTKSVQEELKFVEQDKKEIEKDIIPQEKDESVEDKEQEFTRLGGQEQEDEEITIEGLRNTFGEDEAEVEFKKELERAQRELDIDPDEIELPDIKTAVSKEEDPDEEDSLSFMIRHKKEQEKEQEFTRLGGHDKEKVQGKEQEFTRLGAQETEQEPEIEQEFTRLGGQQIEQEQEQDKEQEFTRLGVQETEQEPEQEFTRLGAQEIEQVQEKEHEQEFTLLGGLEQEDELVLDKKYKTGDDEEKIGFHGMELAEILERKEMTTIIDVIFDYDIESFASLLDEISSCSNVEEAHQIINQELTNRDIDRNSSEAESFRSIISEFFNQK